MSNGAEYVLSLAPTPCLRAVFEGRVLPYRARIRGFLRQHVDADTADDLTQDVLLAAFRSLNTLRDLHALERWLFCTAAHHLASFYRKRSRQTPTLSLAALTGESLLAHTTAAEHAAPASPASGADIARLEDRLWVEALLQHARYACTPLQWEVLWRCYAGDDMHTIAQRLQLDSATVRSHFRRGRACLLSQVFVHAPDLVGGRERLDAVTHWLEETADGADVLSAQDREALRDPARHVKSYRAVCLKIARHLPLPL